MKETLKPQAYEQSKDDAPGRKSGARLLACLLKNEPASHYGWRG